MPVESLPIADGHLLFLPLCPSTNSRMRPIHMGRRCRNILTPEARLYISSIGTALKVWAKKKRFQPISAYTYADLWFILPRTNCDAHNYGKVLFDALEVGGIVTNDKFILPRVMGVWHDSKSQVIVKIPATVSA